ncbi:MAG TPA: EF-hand domain-containing protein [Opitutaceae bacterium]|nr:EF-hand domain-containing protein [Opitutaceae bacterium]
MNIPSSGAAGSSEIVSGASAPMSPAQKMSDLFAQIDTSGSGSISQSQFDQAFQTLNPPPSFQAAGADSVWAKLDPNATGSVSKQDFVSTMTSFMKQLRGHHLQRGSADGAASISNSTSFLAALQSSGGESATVASTAASSGSVGTFLDFLA